MHDIKLIRNNPNEFDLILKNRNFKPISSEVVKLDLEIRKLKKQLQDLQEKRNSKSKEIGFLIQEKKDPTSIQNQVKDLIDCILKDISYTILHKKTDIY